MLKLPRADEATVSREKVELYLLSRSHPIGAFKARYFRSRGYASGAPERLEVTLLEIARSGQVTSTERSEWGTKYVVVGEAAAPDGDLIALTTVWLVSGGGPPQLVTAYPNRGDAR